MKAANHAPLYCALYPELAEIARRHGYAMALHGSLSRDFDLICIPWTEAPADPQAVVDDIKAALFCVPESPVRREHGRVAYPLCFTDECYIDLSFMPRLQVEETRANA